MRFKVKQSLIELIQGNIVDQDVDAIVNAANSSLLGGGGVDSAIHYAAGPELLAECRTLGGCPTGQARITAGYRLKAGYVIHTVGPVYRTIGRINWDGDAADDRHSEAELLASAYRNSLLLASQHGIKTIAFPSISTGAYGYPLEEAAPIALGTVKDYLLEHPEIQLVRFVLWDGEARVAFQRAAKARWGDPDD
jgi:O-acetyl-ADP-ribose deacetylase (regulator of RNase III)